MWLCVTVTGLVAAPVVGPFSDSYNPQYLFWLLIPCAAQILYPLIKKGYLEEEYVQKGERKVQWRKFQEYVAISAHDANHELDEFRL